MGKSSCEPTNRSSRPITAGQTLPFSHSGPMTADQSDSPTPSFGWEVKRLQEQIQWSKLNPSDDLDHSEPSQTCRPLTAHRGPVTVGQSKWAIHNRPIRADPSQQPRLLATSSTGRSTTEQPSEVLAGAASCFPAFTPEPWLTFDSAVRLLRPLVPPCAPAALLHISESAVLR